MINPIIFSKINVNHNYLNVFEKHFFIYPTILSKLKVIHTNDEHF